jgi:hypothetical protein
LSSGGWFFTGGSISLYGDVNCFDNMNVGGNVAVTTIAVPIGVWYHLAFAYNNSGGSVKIYVNGTLAGNRTGIPTSLGLYSNRTGNIIGYAGNHQLDEIKLYNKTLNQAQVQLDMANVGIPSGVC